MHQFCFNDCMPMDADEYQLVSGLKQTLMEYHKLKSDFSDEVNGIITHKLPSQLFINSTSFSLLNCIDGLDRPLRRIAYAYFNKYPIDKNFLVKDEDDLITGEYSIVIENAHHNAINAKIVAENEGVLFTLAIHDDLKKNVLDIHGVKQTTTTVNNLFGEPMNTGFINNLIIESINSKLGNFDKLLAIFGSNSYNEKFKRSFENVPKAVQDSIINHFQKAVERHGATMFYADGDLIKDVTPEKETQIKILELRIFDPIAYRVYFFEKDDKIYLALAEQKSSPKVQDGQIKNAGSIIKQLLLLEN